MELLKMLVVYNLWNANLLNHSFKVEKNLYHKLHEFHSWRTVLNALLEKVMHYTMNFIVHLKNFNEHSTILNEHKKAKTLPIMKSCDIL